MAIIHHVETGLLQLQLIHVNSIKHLKYIASQIDE